MVIENKETTIIRESIERYELIAEEYIEESRARVHCLGFNVDDYDRNTLVAVVANLIIRTSAKLN